MLWDKGLWRRANACTFKRNKSCWPKAVGVDLEQAGYEKNGTEIQRLKVNGRIACHFLANGTGQSQLFQSEEDWATEASHQFGFSLGPYGRGNAVPLPLSFRTMGHSCSPGKQWFMFHERGFCRCWCLELGGRGWLLVKNYIYIYMYETSGICAYMCCILLLSFSFCRCIYNSKTVLIHVLYIY